MNNRAVPWVLLVAAIASAGFFGWKWRSATAGDREQTQVKAVAARLLVALTNFDGTTIDGDVTTLRGLAVGRFAGDVRNVFTAARIAQIKKFKVTSTGKLRSAFIQALSGGNATVFGVVDETTDNSTTQPKSDTVRFDIALIDTKDGWKIENVEILQSPGATPGLGG